MSEHGAEKDAPLSLTAVDARKCAFVCWVDLDGKAHMHSEAGYSQRQIAGMLRQMADICDRNANEASAEKNPCEHEYARAVYGDWQTCPECGSSFRGTPGGGA